MVRFALCAFLASVAATAAIAQEGASAPLAVKKCSQETIAGNWFITFQLEDNVACVLQNETPKRFTGACIIRKFSAEFPAVATLNVNDDVCGVSGQIKSDGNFKLDVLGRVSIDGAAMIGTLVNNKGAFFPYQGLKAPTVE